MHGVWKALVKNRTRLTSIPALVRSLRYQSLLARTNAGSILAASLSVCNASCVLPCSALERGRTFQFSEQTSFARIGVPVHLKLAGSATPSFDACRSAVSRMSERTVRQAGPPPNLRNCDCFSPGPDLAAIDSPSSTARNREDVCRRIAFNLLLDTKIGCAQPVPGISVLAVHPWLRARTAPTSENLPVCRPAFANPTSGSTWSGFSLVAFQDRNRIDRIVELQAVYAHEEVRCKKIGMANQGHARSSQ